jgi:FlaA1/EpsC-like NDP-sugar epimerase
MTRPVLARLGTILFDIGMVCVAYAFALWLRFDGDVPNVSWNYLLWAGPLIGIAYVVAYSIVGVYRTAWQYAGARDAVFMVAAVGVVTAGVLGVNALLPTRPLPLTVNVISAAFVLLLHVIGRKTPGLLSQAIVSTGPTAAQKRVMIVGAGDTGQQLAWELQHNTSLPYRAVCFVDEDTSLKGKNIQRLPVVGGRFEIPTAIEKYDIELVAIALATSGTSELGEIFAMCEASGVPVRVVPSMADVVAGKAQRGELRELTMEDLLARAPLDIDEDACRAAIFGKVVLITGASGSIGAELTRRIASFAPAALHLVDASETGLYELRGDVMREGGDLLAERLDESDDA